MRLIAMGLVGLFSLAGANRAAAWDPFLVENDKVRAGNEALSEGEAARALEHYDRAARELPDRAEVHLNRGLALLEMGELDRAREALRLASQPPASREVRADAYYDLGLAFYRQAEQAASAEEPNHREAQRLFREAADAFRQSLRQRPGNADAGWNLELALRRIREQQEEEQRKREEQQQQQQEKQEQNEQDSQQDEQQEDTEETPHPADPQSQPDSEPPENQDTDDQSNRSDGEPESSPSPEDQAGESEQPDSGEQSSDGDESSSGPSEEQPERREAPSNAMEGLPPEHQRVLDALEQGEENLERHRARVRAQRERRRVEQDW